MGENVAKDMELDYFRERGEREGKGEGVVVEREPK